jgi:hypothetical protein
MVVWNLRFHGNWSFANGRTTIFNWYGHLGEAPAKLVWPDKGGYVKLCGK